MRIATPFVVATSFLGVGACAAADWPHWRGPNRDGIVSEPSGWHDGRWTLDEVWTASVGTGSTSPLVVDGKLYTMGWRDEQDILVCLDAATGEELWRVAYPCPNRGRHATGDEWGYAGPTTTPEYDRQTQYLYTLSNDGDLICWDCRDRGERIWGINLYDEYNVRQRPKIGRGQLRDYGYTTAPIVHSEWLIVQVGSDEGNLMAFDKRTGERQWTSESRDPAGHAGGLAPMIVEGVSCLAAQTLRNILVVRLDGKNAGRTVAEFPWATDYANGIATPAVHENFVLVTSGYNQNAIAKLKITLDGGAQEVWKRPVYSKICTPIIHDGYIYWASDTLRCLGWNSGEQKWEGGRTGDAGSVILASDNRLVVWADRGTLQLVESANRSPNDYRRLAEKRDLFSTEVWPHAALADGCIYCKDREGNLKCIAVK